MTKRNYVDKLSRLVTLHVVIALSFLLGAKSFAANVTTGVNVFSYAGTNVTTSAYVTLVASTPYNVSKFQMCDTSTKILKFATGSAGNEVDLWTNTVSGCVLIPVAISAGSRIAVEAVDATASSGYNTLSFFP